MGPQNLLETVNLQTELCHLGQCMGHAVRSAIAWTSSGDPFSDIFFFFFCLHCRLKHIVFRFKWKIMYCKSSPRENTAASPIPLPSTNTLFVRSMSPIKTNRRTGTRSLLRAFCLLPSLMRSRPVNCIVQC